MSVYPDNVFERWRVRFPDDPDQEDPREPRVCACGQTFTWRGYDGLCGWCEWDRIFLGRETGPGVRT
jgi:hypothetical protein